MPVVAIDEHKHSSADLGASPPSLALRGEDRQLLRKALEQLSREYREVIVRRELEGFTPCALRSATPAHLSQWRQFSAVTSPAGCLTGARRFLLARRVMAP